MLLSTLFFISSLVSAAVSPTELSQQTLERFERVPEFEFIIREANKIGVKVYLFGGTASAFAHYVRWDLEREAGDEKYQEERFDYDFTNIYRGNQDLDIVVDGTPEQADQLKTILRREYPHFVGDRDAWEVRLLRESRGDKQALIGDEDFKKQHSDTNSTGMLLLNPDPQGIVYNDLLNWGSKDSDFLNDVAAARIKFLFSDEHETTERFKKGLNPPALAAIRYLAKLAQYEVKGSEKDLKTVTQIIQDTDFITLSDYGKKKSAEFALKTLLNAPNFEYAWNLLEKTGARKKLIEMDGNQIDKRESLSWWMNKEPLRSHALGKKGKTAREIFGTDEIIVSHETNSFKAYDNITRSSKGGANAFISRQDFIGEVAAYGDGFYTKRGLKGARATGLTIRFKLHPEAREGIDFIHAAEIDFVIVKNKKALVLIQENLNLSLIDFLKLIANSDISENDRGLREKFLRKFRRTRIDSHKFQEALEFVKSKVFISEDFPYAFEMDEKEIMNVDHLMRNLIEGRAKYSRKLGGLVHQSEVWENRPDRVISLIKILGLTMPIVQKILSKDWVINYPELVDWVIENKRADIPLLAEFIFSNPKWKDHNILFAKAMKNMDEKGETNKFAFYVFAQGLFTDFIKELKGGKNRNFAGRTEAEGLIEFLIEGDFKDPGEFFINIMEYNAGFGFGWKSLIKNSSEFWSQYPHVGEYLIDHHINTDKDIEFFVHFISHLSWFTHSKLWEKIFSSESKHTQLKLVHNLPSKFWKLYPHLIDKIFEKKFIQEFQGNNVLSAYIVYV